MVHVSVNMAASIDGKIATKARGPVKLGSSYDSKRMGEIRALQDLILHGASTYAAHPFPLTVHNAALLRERVRNGLSTQPISALVSSGLTLKRKTPFERAHSVERWIFCGSKAAKSRRDSWESAGVRIIQGKKPQVSAKEMHRYWEKQGLRKVLLEGGGALNASFFEADLVDRIYLTLCPILIGGAESLTMFEGKGLRKFPRFTLVESLPVEDELYLIYERA